MHMLNWKVNLNLFAYLDLIDLEVQSSPDYPIDRHEGSLKLLSHLKRLPHIEWESIIQYGAQLGINDGFSVSLGHQV